MCYVRHALARLDNEIMIVSAAVVLTVLALLTAGQSHDHPFPLLMPDHSCRYSEYSYRYSDESYRYSENLYPNSEYSYPYSEYSYPYTDESWPYSDDRHPIRG